MKKFLFSPNRLIVVGILFFLMTTLIHFLVDDVLKVVAIFLLSLVLMGLFYYQQKVYETDDTQGIEQMTNLEESSLEQLLESMPVGIIKFEPTTFEIGWLNPYANLVCSSDDGRLETDFLMDIIRRYQQESMAIQMIHDKKYTISIDFKNGMLYFYQGGSEESPLALISEMSPVIGVISVDNYDDATENLPDAEISRLNGLIANFISTFTNDYNIFYRRVEMDRFYIFTDYSVLSRLMSEKFKLLDDFKVEAQKFDLPLTLSIGISFGQMNHAAIGHIAQKNLNMALVRGGDQVVVKENDERKEFIYFGGSSVSTVKRSRTRTRAMMTAISDKLKTADKVFVVGHRNLDMDAIGATVGMEFFASNILPETYAVYDDQNMAIDVARAMVRLREDGKTHLLPLSEAISKVTDHSLLIMVDHSKMSLTLSNEFYELFSEVIVVDHHRRDDDFPDNAVLTFIESGASSASELVTELIQFQNAKTKLSKIQASVVMAGIMLDTKNFTTRVTSRTFDVGSYLRTLGSDSTEIQQISATDFDDYRDINELILNSERPWQQVIIAHGSEDKIYTNVTTSKAADTILEMSEIEASFVVAKNSHGTISVSARSRSKINVQRMMEALGGGGHFNLAACQISEKSIPEVIAMIKELLQEEMNEDK